MPWCDTCDTQVMETDVSDCGECGNSLDTADSVVVSSSIPWHFWIVIIALAGYLVWRFTDFLIQIVT